MIFLNIFYAKAMTLIGNLYSNPYILIEEDDVTIHYYINGKNYVYVFHYTGNSYTYDGDSSIGKRLVGKLNILGAMANVYNVKLVCETFGYVASVILNNERWD